MICTVELKQCKMCGYSFKSVMNRLKVDNDNPFLHQNKSVYKMVCTSLINKVNNTGQVSVQTRPDFVSLVQPLKHFFGRRAPFSDLFSIDFTSYN